MEALRSDTESVAIRRHRAAYIVMRRVRLPRAALFRQAMAEYLELHPVDPQPRLIRRAAEVVRAGGLIAYPTDSCYALGWHIGDKHALGAGAPHPPGGPSSPLHAGVRQPGRSRPLRAARNLAVPHAARLPARPIHLPVARHARDSAPPATRAAAHHRRAHPRPPGYRVCCSPSSGEPLMSSTLLLAADPQPLTSRPRDPGAPRARDRRDPRRRELWCRADHGRRPLGHAAGDRAQGQGRSRTNHGACAIIAPRESQPALHTT